MPEVKVGSHWLINKRSAVGRSTFTVIAIEGDKVVVHGQGRRVIKLSTFADHRKQYKLLKDAN